MAQRRWIFGAFERTNLADRSVSFVSPNLPKIDHEPWLLDFHILTAPVGSFRANPYGLHDIIGNVREMCRERLGGYDNEVVGGEGERQVTSDAFRTARGGSCGYLAAYSRSTYRGRAPPEETSPDCGIRPVRRLDRE